MDGGEGKHGAEDQRLDVPAAIAVEDPVDEEWGPGAQGGDGEDRRGDREYAQGLVHRVGPEDREGVSAHVVPRGWKEARLALYAVGLDRNLIDREEHLSRLDQALERVREARDDLNLQGSLSVVGAKAGSGVFDLGA